MIRWNQAPLIRDQVVLFSPTLDAAISEDHCVRLVDEVLRQMDWSAWESRYVLLAGQPPIHPRIVAGGHSLRADLEHPLQPEVRGCLSESHGFSVAG